MSLGTKAREAVFWTTGFSLFRDILQLGITLVLARLLPPDAYGRFALVTTVIGFFTVLSFREFLLHTVQVRDDSQVHYQDHFTAGVVVQLVIFGLVNAAAFGLRWTATYASIAPMLHVMSMLFLLDLPSEFRVKMLERALDWKRLRLLQAAGLVGNAAAAILLAVAGAGAWALLLPSLLVPLPFIYDLFLVERWRPTWTWSGARYAAAWRFGANRVSSLGLSTGSQLLESAVLARSVGFSSLGFFNRATGLAQMSCMRVAGVVGPSLYPVLTKYQPDSDAFRRVTGLMLRSVAWVVIPLGAIVAVLGRPVVATLYGRQWLTVVPLLPWALAAGVLAALLHVAYFALLAHEQQHDCLSYDASRLAGVVVLLATLAGFGISAYLKGLVGLHVIGFSMVASWLVRGRAVTPGGIAAALVPAVAAATNSLALCELARRGLGVTADTFVPAALYGAVFGILYVLFLRLLFRRLLRELVACLPNPQRLERLLLLGATGQPASEAV